MKRESWVVSPEGSVQVSELAQGHKQALRPLWALIEQERRLVQEQVKQLARAALEPVLLASAEQVVGPAHPGRQSGGVRRHGRQLGMVRLGGLRVRLLKPRLRERGRGEGAEVEIPAYVAMQSDEARRERVLSILLREVSARNYLAVATKLARCCGVPKRAMSKHLAEASARTLCALSEPRLKRRGLCVILIGERDFGRHHVIAAVGVQRNGKMHVLGIREGTAAARRLVDDLVARGVRGDSKRLFVVTGSRVLRTPLEIAYGVGGSAAGIGRVPTLAAVLRYLPRQS